MPLGLLREHFDEIEALWMVRRSLLFSKRFGRTRLCELDARLEAHRRALHLHRGEAEREADLRLHSPVPAEVFSGMVGLLELRPERCRRDASRIVANRRRPFAVLDALRHGPAEVARWGETEDPILVDAASFHRPVSSAGLGKALSGPGPLRRAALIALARHPLQPVSDRSVFEHAATCDDPVVMTAGLYGFGLADPGGFADLVERLGDAVFAVPAAPVCLGVFGDARTARRLCERIERHGPSAELFQALGILGVPSGLPPVVEATRGCDALAWSAVAALHTATGSRFEFQREGPQLEFGSGIPLHEFLSEMFRVDPPPEPDPELASRHVAALCRSPARNVRHHLGEPLHAARTDAPLSHDWLRAVTERTNAPLRFEVPDALFGEGYGAVELDPDHLFFPAPVSTRPGPAPDV